MGLTLKIGPGERFFIGDDIIVTRVKGSEKIRIEAPKSTVILRESLVVKPGASVLVMGSRAEVVSVRGERVTVVVHGAHRTVDKSQVRKDPSADYRGRR